MNTTQFAVYSRERYFMQCSLRSLVLLALYYIEGLSNGF